jgi:hypothetical protein
MRRKVPVAIPGCRHHIRCVPLKTWIGNMDRDYCVLDGSLPCMLDGADGWFFSAGAWHWICSGDVIHNGRVVSREYFDKVFGDLPPLPD